MRDVFRDALIEEVGLKGHPKANQVFGIAWEDEHSSGYLAVYYKMEELAKLFTDDDDVISDMQNVFLTLIMALQTSLKGDRVMCADEIIVRAEKYYK